MHFTRLSSLLSLSFFSLFILTTLASQEPPPSDHHHHQVRDRMNEFVDTAKHAIDDAEAATNKRDVVDLGQSLHLLESKFSALRTALSEELGARSSKFTSHNSMSKQLMDKSSNLIGTVVQQREELRQLSKDVKEVDNAIRALRSGLEIFDQEVTELQTIVANLHVAQKGLNLVHHQTREKLMDAVLDTHEIIHSGSHWLLYFALLLELVIFVAYLYYKKYGKLFARKPFDKFG